jgi:hypothetical protein
VVKSGGFAGGSRILWNIRNVPMQKAQLQKFVIEYVLFFSPHVLASIYSL